MDILILDMAMKEECEAAKNRRNSRPNQRAVTSADDTAFHFIAYLPIQGDLWKLDGLDRFPQKLGKIVDLADSMNYVGDLSNKSPSRPRHRRRLARHSCSASCLTHGRM